MPRKGLDDFDTLLTSFLPATCAQKLSTNAKKLTLGDLWRLQGWRFKSEGPPGGSTRFKELDVDDLNSIATAFECNVATNGGPNGNDWKYRPEMSFACCCCTACAVVVPPDMVG